MNGWATRAREWGVALPQQRRRAAAAPACCLDRPGFFAPSPPRSPHLVVKLAAGLVGVRAPLAAPQAQPAQQAGELVSHDAWLPGGWSTSGVERKTMESRASNMLSEARHGQHGAARCSQRGGARRASAGLASIRLFQTCTAPLAAAWLPRCRTRCCTRWRQPRTFRRRRGRLPPRRRCCCSPTPRWAEIVAPVGLTAGKTGQMPPPTAQPAQGLPPPPHAAACLVACLLPACLPACHLVTHAPARTLQVLFGIGPSYSFQELQVGGAFELKLGSDSVGGGEASCAGRFTSLQRQGQPAGTCAMQV